MPISLMVFTCAMLVIYSVFRSTPRGYILFVHVMSSLPMFLIITGFHGLMSCPVTGDPIQASSPTNVLYVKRSLPAVTTCQNTSKSIVFHETAGQFVQQTDSSLQFH
ncbi:hypothetical protein CRENBAI_020641 [Crenichthys baileyi]|uniref:Uncharacterized protein n=1 Tax=Crenichthys baileyi TaxID=28760 RepID=A0AAV9RTT2_9TELE